MTTQDRVPRPAKRSGPVYRWLCRCQEPPVLLGTYEPNGRINIKVRDRYWHIFGQVETTCPRCGAVHMLDGMNPPHTTSPASDQDHLAT